MPILNVTVDIPALSDLVAYLKGRDQAKIDALTATVDAVTKQMADSSTALKASVGEQKNA